MNRIMAPALIALMLTGTGFIIKTHQERTGAEKRKKHEIFLGSLNKQAPLLKKEGGFEPEFARYYSDGAVWIIKIMLNQ